MTYECYLHDAPLVDATACSRPAFKYTPSPVARAIKDPTTLTTEIQGTPFSSPNFTARCTSFVSPESGGVQ